LIPPTVVRNYSEFVSEKHIHLQVISPIMKSTLLVTRSKILIYPSSVAFIRTGGYPLEKINFGFLVHDSLQPLKCSASWGD
jgi:hypothetical protein